jgi:YD repeat-containing protein
LNRLTKEINSGKEILYSYDETGNMVELTYPDGRKVTRKFDNQDRLKQILSGNKQLVDYTYDSLSLKNKSYANNTQTSYTYDNLLRLKSLNTNFTTGSGEIISNYSYDYDKNGNIISDGTEIYTYDIYNRLEKVDYSMTLSETFDFDNM